MQIEVILLITINKLPRLRQLIYFIVLISLLELRCSVVLCSGALVNMDEHVVQEVNTRKDNFTLVELSDVLDSVIVEVALYGMDLIVEHESVDEHRTSSMKNTNGAMLSRDITNVLTRSITIPPIPSAAPRADVSM